MLDFRDVPKQEEIPPVLREILKKLTIEQALEVHDFLDGAPKALIAVILYIEEIHHLEL